MPEQLLDFYARLVKEMAADMGKQRAQELQIVENEEISRTIESITPKYFNQ